MDKSYKPSLSVITTMFLLNMGIVLSVLSLHEVGHVLVGMYVGCEQGRAVIFDTSQEGPYAELYCSDGVSHKIAYMGSLLVTVAFGSTFLFLRKSPQRNLFFIIIGFSIMFASLDIAAFLENFHLSIIAYNSSFAATWLFLSENRTLGLYLERATQLLTALNLILRDTDYGGYYEYRELDVRGLIEPYGINITKYAFDNWMAILASLECFDRSGLNLFYNFTLSIGCTKSVIPAH